MIRGTARAAIRRNPGVCAMAKVTFRGSRNMSGTFTGSNNVIVTAGTDTNNFIVIHCGRCNRRPGSRERLMTGITDIGTVNMGGTFTTGISAIMAGNTATRCKG